MGEVIIVVPCYNEAKRLELNNFFNYAKLAERVKFLFVNDGSTDNTSEIINKFCQKNKRSFSAMNLQQHVGKAETVRIGINKAFEYHPEYTAMWDADLSTPLEEIQRFINFLDNRLDIHILLGSRVKLLGRIIERQPLRHYMGRAGATLISMALSLGVYDTQCGAKMFRVTSSVELIFKETFKSFMIFDVEIIARYFKIRKIESIGQPECSIYELPLNEWRYKKGSKIKTSDYLRSLYDLLVIWHHYH